MGDLVVWVYIVRCADGSYYVGSTRQDPEARVWEHNEGLVKSAYTYSRRPVVLLYCEDYASWTDCFARERQLKGWSRDKKEALIAQDWDALQRLSRTAKPPGSAVVGSDERDASENATDNQPGNELRPRLEPSS